MAGEALVYNDNPGSLPASFVIPPGVEITPESVSAVIDGSGAAGSFLACLAAYSQDGKLVGRWFPSQVLAAGDTAEVSWGPFGGDAASAAAPATPIVASGSFTPFGGFQTLVSTNVAAPDNVVTSSSFTADGVTTYRIDFFVAAIDIGVSVGGTGTAMLIALAIDATNLGLLTTYNVVPQAGIYGSTPCFLSAFDTPAAGTHTYSILANKSLGGGAAATMRLYGSNIGPPFTNVTHPGYIAVYAL